MDNLTLEAKIEQMEARSLHQFAEIMALREFVSVRLCPALNIDAKVAFDEIENRKKIAHAKLLRALEDKDAGLAARLDKRPGLPEE